MNVGSSRGYLLAALAFAAPAVAVVPMVFDAGDLDVVAEQRPSDALVGGDWLGLYKSQGVTRVVPVQLTLEPDAAGGGQLRVAPPDPLFVVSRIPAVREGPAVTVARDVSLTFPREDIERGRRLVLGEREYRVWVDVLAEDFCDAQVNLSDGTRSQRLFDAAHEGDFSCDEPHLELHWAGDIDGDGRLDLLVTLSRKYSHFPRCLLLSSAAAPDELVRCAAALDLFAQ